MFYTIFCFLPLKESNWKFLELLIKADPDLNKANANGDYPLELAVNGGQDTYSFRNTDTNLSTDILSKMLDNGANPNLTASGKNSPLILAIMENLYSIVNLLLLSGADMFHIGENESTVFEYCFKSSKCVFKLTNI